MAETHCVGTGIAQKCLVVAESPGPQDGVRTVYAGSHNAAAKAQGHSISRRPVATPSLPSEGDACWESKG